MKNRTLSMIFILLGFLFLVFTVYLYAIPNAIQSQTVTINPSLDVHEELELEQGDGVRANLIVHNGIEGVNVYVLDPREEKVYDGGTVYTNLEFTFMAQVSGSYVIKFQNPSPTNNQIIEYTLTYPTFPGIVKIITNAIGAILLGIGIAKAYMSRKK